MTTVLLDSDLIAEIKRVGHAGFETYASPCSKAGEDNLRKAPA